jgi:hypothetical protein
VGCTPDDNTRPICVGRSLALACPSARPLVGSPCAAVEENCCFYQTALDRELSPMCGEQLRCLGGRWNALAFDCVVRDAGPFVPRPDAGVDARDRDTPPACASDATCSTPGATCTGSGQCPLVEVSVQCRCVSAGTARWQCEAPACDDAGSTGNRDAASGDG